MKLGVFVRSKKVKFNFYPQSAFKPEYMSVIGQQPNFPKNFSCMVLVQSKTDPED
jgi:hypothetical protein